MHLINDSRFQIGEQLSSEIGHVLPRYFQLHYVDIYGYMHEDGSVRRVIVTAGGRWPTGDGRRAMGDDPGLGVAIGTVGIGGQAFVTGNSRWGTYASQHGSLSGVSAALLASAPYLMYRADTLYHRPISYRITSHSRARVTVI